MTPAHSLTLPGISAEYLHRARVSAVDAAQALSLCGIQQSGLLFPYYDFHGERVTDGDADFARLRLDGPRGDQKYHQRGGSAPHAYLPPSFWEEDKNLHNPVIIIEGEKKALALGEAGFTAVGIGGSYNFRDLAGGLVPEFAEMLQYITDPFFIFLGDRDVTFNYQFSHAACAFAALVTPARVLVTCLPLDAPGKGGDDCRQALGEGFHPWFADRLFAGALHGPQATAASIASELVHVQRGRLSALKGADREAAIHGLAKLAAGLNHYPLEENKVIALGVETLGVGRQPLKRLMKEARQKVAMEPLSGEAGGDVIPLVNLGEQPGTWTQRALEIIGPRTYLYAGNLCDQHEGKFAAHSPASLVPLLDAPDCCRFVRPGRQGAIAPTQLAEKDTRLVLGALRQHGEVLQPVDLLTQIPALVWSPIGGAQLITGYSREHRILAVTPDVGTTAAMELPEPSAAAADLLQLMRDFDFASPGDAGRALAFLFTPALACGRFLDSGRTPFFLVEKDQKGAGAGTFMRMLAALYAIPPTSISPGNPKAAREDLSKHLLEGANLIYLDNIRGKILTGLDFLESLLTESSFICRAPYVHGVVDVSRRVIACTSNGAVLSPDLADRTVKVTIRKRPDGFRHHAWPEGGDLVDHVVANRSRYLACVYALIDAWARQQRPAGSHLSGFLYAHWERACTWILETFFAPLPLLDAEHRVGQQRLANADFDLLRGIFRAALDQGSPGPLTATDLVRIAAQANRMSEEAGAVLKMGRILSGEFPNADSFEFAGEFRVVRHDVCSEGTNYEWLKTYVVTPLPGKREAMPQGTPAVPVPHFVASAPPPPVPLELVTS